MKLSKLSLTFALVVSAHVALLGLILLQPGCKNNLQEPTIIGDAAAAQTGVMRPPSPTEEVAVVEAEVVAEFQPPTRPAWTETAEAKTVEGVGSSAPEVARVSTYTIQRGDSLSRIAKKHGVSVAALAAANNINVNSILRLGQTLVIPASAKAQASAASPAEPVEIVSEKDTAVYVVAKGDSLSKIAAKHGTSVRALQRLNGLSSTNIRAGQKLRVPSVSAGTAVSAAAAPAAASGNTHTIVAGDTLGALAKKYGVKLSALQAANPGVDSSRLRIGQKIVIPASAAPAPAAQASAAEPEIAALSEAAPAPAPAAEASAPAPAPEAIPEAPVVPAANVEAIPEAPVVPAAGALNE